MSAIADMRPTNRGANVAAGSFYIIGKDYNSFSNRTLTASMHRVFAAQDRPQAQEHSVLPEGTAMHVGRHDVPSVRFIVGKP